MNISTMEAETLSILDGVTSNSLPFPCVKKEETETETDVKSRYTIDCTIVKNECNTCEYTPSESILDFTDDFKTVKVENTNSSDILESISDFTDDFKTVKAENTNSSDVPDCNAKSSTKTNEPFTLNVIDDDGLVLQTFVQVNGVIKPYVPELNKPKTKIQNKKPLKKRRIRQISHETNQILKKKHRKKNLNRDEVLKNKLYSCKLCDSEFEGRKPFKQHLYQHIKTENNEHVCCFCHYSTPNRGHLHVHILRRHYHFKNEKLFTCNTCDKGFCERKDLKRHMFVHTQKGNFKCKFCDFSHVRKSSFENHLHSCHAIPPVKSQGHGDKTADFQSNEKNNLCECDYCGFKSRDKRGMMLHIQRHMGVCKYTCDQCGYSCLQSTDLKKHSTIHSSERPFECSTCSKTFKRRGHLLIHLKGKNNTCLK